MLRLFLVTSRHFVCFCAELLTRAVFLRFAEASVDEKHSVINVTRAEVQRSTSLSLKFHFQSDTLLLIVQKRSQMPG